MAGAATRGFAWMAAQTLASKAVGMLGQLALSWLLMPEHFGLIALAYAVTTFAGLLQQAGIREVLVHRHKRLQLWATPAFWMALALGTLGGVLMVAGAPVAAWAFDEPRVVGLIAVIAISAPISALSTVPMAVLQAQMRFKALASINLVSNTAAVIIQIILAWLGFGAYSFALWRPIVAVLDAAIAWKLASPPVGRRPQLRRWKHLFAHSGLMLGVAFIYTGITQLGPVILGLLRLGEATVGLYFWAYSLSMQLLVMFSMNLKQVLFASLSRLQDEPERQTTGFLRATRLLGMVVTPVCLLQAAVAEPVVRLIFAPRWLDAVPMLQVLSMATGLVVMASPANGMLMAQGRFRAYLAISVVSGALSLSFMPAGGVIGQSVTGTPLGGGLGVAIGTGVYLALAAPLTLWITLRQMGRGWQDVGATLCPPLLLGGLAVGAGYGVQLALREFTTDPLVLIVATSLVAAITYIPAARVLMPESWRELQGLASKFAGRARAR